MRKIVFDTDQAEFRFNAHSVIQHLRLLNEDYDRPDLQRCIDELVACKAEEINLQATPDWFGFVIIALLEKGESQVSCKRCGRAYEAGRLSLFPIGFGKSPFGVTSAPYISFIDRLFRRKLRNPGMFGGKGFRCPAGHKLISAVTWIS